MSKEYTDLPEHHHIMAPSPQHAMLIQQAAEFAQQAHRGQIRRGGAPYYTHVHRVAARVESLTSDAHLTAAAYLHDTMEDCGVTAADIEARFDLQIASLVQELTNDDALKDQLGKEEYMVRKLPAMSAPALLIKLCDTLDNMTETDSAEQALVYARIQQRLQQNLPPVWGDMHQCLSCRILDTYATKFSNLAK